MGIQLSPKWPWGYRLGGKEDFVFGIFGRSECAKGALEHQWARANPNPNPPTCCWNCSSGQWIREGPWAARSRISKLEQALVYQVRAPRSQAAALRTSQVVLHDACLFCVFCVCV